MGTGHGDLTRLKVFAEHAARPSCGRVAIPLAMALAALAYANTLGHQLVWDDVALKTFVDRTVGQGGLPALLRAEFAVGVPVGYYRPLVLLSLWLDGRMSPLLPAAYHATNVTLHALNSGLACALFSRWLPSPAAAAIGAFLFAVHPVHTESVAFVSGRTDLLACTFLLISCLAVGRHLEPGGTRRAAGVGALAYGLACLSKEAAVPLPAVLLACDAIRATAQGGDLKRYWTRNRLWVLCFAAALLVVVCLRVGLAGVGFGRYARHGGFLEAFRQTSLDVVPRVWATYSRLLVLPWPLLSWYRAEDLRLTAVTLGCAATLLAALALTATRANRRIGLCAAAWIFGFVLLVSGWSAIPAGSAVTAERFLYIPSLGYCALAGHLLSRGIDKPFLSKGLAAIAAGAILLMAAGTIIRNRTWESNVTVFREASRAVPDSWVMLANYGTALAERGLHQEAVEEYGRALEHNPGFVLARQNLAISLAALGNRDEAVVQYLEAIRLKPDSLESRSNLALLLLQSRRWAEAVEHYRFALILDPGRVQARINLGNALSKMGRNEEALAEYRTAEALEPYNPLVPFNRGVTLAAMGRWQEAAAAYRAALSLRPDYADARRNLAVALARSALQTPLPAPPASLPPGR